MLPQFYTWQFIEQQLSDNAPVILLFVVESNGSSPGRQGFMMAVGQNGIMHGSIGGGIMEHKFVELAKQKFHEHSEQLLRKQVHDKSAVKDQSGMICSGEQTIYLLPLKQNDLAAVHALVDNMRNGKNGTLQFTSGGFSFTAEIPTQDYFYQFNNPEDWIYREKSGYKKRLTIIGGGHCSLALSRMAASLDFYQTVYEERHELNTLQQNNTAHEKILIESYAALSTLVTAGSDHFVVIMTIGYRTDDIALRAIIDKEFAYLGLLGSRNKIEILKEQLLHDGISQTSIERLHAPIGIDIKSQTPDEIAISILAEIIKKYRKPV
jgi:xanthine dehydrogenase accessory factor